MTHVKEFAGLLLVALGCLLVWDVDRTVNTVHDQLPAIMTNLKQASDTLPETMTAIRTDAKTSTDTSAAMYGMVDDADTLIWKFDDVADAGKGAVNLLGDRGDATFDAGTELLKQGKLTAAQAATAMAEVETMPRHLNQLADNIAETADSLNTFAADAKTAELRDRFSTFLVSLTGFTDKGTVLEGDVHAYIKPYDGPHPKRHAAWQFTQGTLGLGAKIGEGAYYWKGVR